MIKLELIDIDGEVGAVLPPELLADLGADKTTSCLVLERDDEGHLTIKRAPELK